MQTFVNILVLFALVMIVLRFCYFHISQIVKIFHRLQLRKINNQKKLLVELNNLCPVPCYDKCCTLRERVDENLLTQEAYFMSATVPKGDSFHG